MKLTVPLTPSTFERRNMAKPTFKPNPRVNAIFEDLEQYLRFCQDFGYKYDERDLYNWKSYAYQQYNKHVQGKFAKDMWNIDSSRRGR
jgi:hypothetical protein